jgi:glycosyltransferase involved in cell wall biosynthesis
MNRSIGLLITYHDERELLGECLRSLIMGENRPDEILVYDDASAEPAVAYVPPDIPVNIVRSETNLGPARARNALLRASSADFVHFHDADDLFHKDWSRRVRQVIGSGDLDAVFTEISAIDETGHSRERVLGLDRLTDGRDLVQFCIEGAMLVPAGTYRRSVVLAIGGYREELWQSEDFDFHVRLAASGIQYGIITDPLVSIRIRPTGRSQNREEVWSSGVQALRRLSEELPRKYRPALANAAARAGSVLFQLGARNEARAAFELAMRLGPPSFSHRRRLYRALATAFGPNTAESLGMCYRGVLPEPVRRLVATCGL